MLITQLYVNHFPSVLANMKLGILGKKKFRGRTTCKAIHARSWKAREEVTFDKGQPVGPTDKRVSDLTNFLGTMARNRRFVSLLYTNWHAVPDKNIKRMWKYVNVRTITISYFNYLFTISY